MDKIKPTLLQKGFNLTHDFTFKRKVYWHHYLLSDTKDSLFSNIDKNQLIYDLKHNDAFFIFDHSMDPLVQPAFKNIFNNLLGLEYFFKIHGIDLDRVIVLSPTQDFSFYQNVGGYDYVAAQKREQVNKEFFHIFHNSLWKNFKDYILRKAQTELPLDKVPEKHFLCLARRDNLNRRFTNYQLHKNNLFKKGIVSHQRVVENEIIKSNSELVSEIKLMSSRKDFDVEKFLEFGFRKHFLDDILDKGVAAVDTKFHAQLSQKVCFELVTETDVKGDFFLTEKTLKPIFCKTPFMISGSCYALRFLKTLGFQTFDLIFDESYDKEIIFYDRNNLIMKNLKGLCSLPLSNCLKLVNSVKDILEFNRDHFLDNDWSFDLELKVNNRIDKVLNVQKF